MAINIFSKLIWYDESSTGVVGDAGPLFDDEEIISIDELHRENTNSVEDVIDTPTEVLDVPVIPDLPEPIIPDLPSVGPINPIDPPTVLPDESANVIPTEPTEESASTPTEIPTEESASTPTEIPTEESALTPTEIPIDNVTNGDTTIEFSDANSMTTVPVSTSPIVKADESASPIGLITSRENSNGDTVSLYYDTTANHWLMSCNGITVVGSLDGNYYMPVMGDDGQIASLTPITDDFLSSSFGDIRNAGMTLYSREKILEKLQNDKQSSTVNNSDSCQNDTFASKIDTHDTAKTFDKLKLREKSPVEKEHLALESARRKEPFGKTASPSSMLNSFNKVTSSVDLKTEHVDSSVADLDKNKGNSDLKIRGFYSSYDPDIYPDATKTSKDYGVTVDSELGLRDNSNGDLPYEKC